MCQVLQFALRPTVPPTMRLVEDLGRKPERSVTISLHSLLRSDATKNPNGVMSTCRPSSVSLQADRTTRLAAGATAGSGHRPGDALASPLLIRNGTRNTDASDSRPDLADQPGSEAAAHVTRHEPLGKQDRA